MRLLFIPLLFGGSGPLLADMPDQATCADVYDVEANPTPQNVLSLYIMRRPEDQRSRIFRGHLEETSALFQEVWALRRQRVDVDDQVRALLADMEEQKQEEAVHQARLDQARRETRLRQQELDAEATQLRFEAYERGCIPFADEEGRKKLLRIDAQKAELDIALSRQEKQIRDQKISDLGTSIARLTALQTEMIQLDAQLAEKSRMLLDDERQQACAR